jgi:transposase
MNPAIYGPNHGAIQMNVTDGNRYEPLPHDYGRGRLTYSRFRGVTWHRRKRRWLAFAILDGRHRYLGSFPPTKAGELECARWRDDMLKRHGILAGLNFPLT